MDVTPYYAIVAATGQTRSLLDIFQNMFSSPDAVGYFVFNAAPDETQGYWFNDGLRTRLIQNGVEQTSFGVAMSGDDSIVIGDEVWPGVFLTASFSTPIGYSYAYSWLPILPAAYADPTPEQVTGSDVVAAAEHLLATVGATYTPNGCHNIAATIAAMAGAPLPEFSGSIIPSENEDGGFWRVVHRGDQTPVANWTALLQPGDIVRYDYADPTEPQHTFVALATSGSFVRTIDNWGETLNEHWEDFSSWANPASVTIYRITEALNTIWGDGDANGLIGSARNDRIVAAAGGDWLDGGLGDDVLEGGDGDDLLRGVHGADTIDGGSGVDCAYYDTASAGVFVNLSIQGAQNTVSAGVDTLASIENLIGSDYSDQLTGDGGANRLEGRGGDDRLEGGGGVDVLVGGDGDDVYVVDVAADVVVEAAGGGADSVLTLVSYALAANQEIERLSALYAGSTAAMNLTGNAFAQTIEGTGGANSLNGGGGADVMRGYGGDDTYYVDNAGDQVFEAAGGGLDWVRTLVSYALAANQEIERLSALYATSTAAMTLIGNAFGQTIEGNAGANLINGGGGADAMRGYGGDDTYYVDNAGDQVFEAVGGGSDWVRVLTSYTLAANQEIERLSALYPTSATAMTLIGNAFGQTIEGNAGANLINGGGGADAMRGYGGDDTYYVDNAGDQVFEAAGGGLDWVRTLTSCTLVANQEIERLSALYATSTAAMSLTGNAFGQTIEGNNGANILNGGGGADRLTGRGGADIFRFSSTLGAGNVDVITDFSVADDTIQLNDSVFTTLAVGGLANSAFTIGAAATDSLDRIVYNSGTGALSYDADGSGAGAAVRFATLSTGLALTAADFTVF